MTVDRHPSTYPSGYLRILLWWRGIVPLLSRVVGSSSASPSRLRSIRSRSSTPWSETTTTTTGTCTLIGVVGSSRHNSIDSNADSEEPSLCGSTQSPSQSPSHSSPAVLPPPTLSTPLSSASNLFSYLKQSIGLTPILTVASNPVTLFPLLTRAQINQHTYSVISSPTVYSDRHITLSSQMNICHVTSRILIIGYPDITYQHRYQSYVNSRYHGKYLIWDLSGAPYDYGIFDDQVVAVDWRGRDKYDLDMTHLTPKQKQQRLKRPGLLPILFEVCEVMKRWMDEDSSHIVIVHDRGTKARSEVLLSCFLMYIGEYDNGFESFQHIASKRARDAHRCFAPSLMWHRRYIQYFMDLLYIGSWDISSTPRPRSLEDELLLDQPVENPESLAMSQSMNRLDGTLPNTRPLILKKMIISSFPQLLDTEKSFIQIFENGNLIFSAFINPHRSFGVAVLDMNDMVLYGDVIIKCKHTFVSEGSSLAGLTINSRALKVTLFKFSFYTGFMIPEVVRVPSQQLDFGTDLFDHEDDFLLDLYFEDVDEDSVNADYDYVEQLLSPSGQRRDDPVISEKKTRAKMTAQMCKDAFAAEDGHLLTVSELLINLSTRRKAVTENGVDLNLNQRHGPGKFLLKVKESTQVNSNDESVRAAALSAMKDWIAGGKVGPPPPPPPPSSMVHSPVALKTRSPAVVISIEDAARALKEWVDGGRIGPPPLPATIPTPPISEMSKKKMTKQLQWDAIPSSKIDDTIWGDVQKSSVSDLVDAEEMSELFAVTQRRSVRDLSDVEDKKIADLIDAKRAQKMGIALSRFKDMGLDKLREYILKLDEKVISLDDIESLFVCLPTAKEMQSVMTYNGTGKLSEGEKWIKIIGDVNYLGERLHVWRTKRTFTDRARHLMHGYDILIKACTQVRDSETFKRVLEVVLGLGNCLNRKQASGFKLSSLIRLTDTKSVNKRTTLLHYLANVIETKMPQLLTFVNELDNIPDAAKLSLDALQTDIRSLSSEVDAAAALLEKIRDNEGPLRDKFLKVMPTFIESALAAVFQLEDESQSVVQYTKDFAEYFGENGSTEMVEGLFKDLTNFLKSFEKAREENLREKEVATRASDKWRHRISNAKGSSYGGSDSSRDQSPVASSTTNDAYFRSKVVGRRVIDTTDHDTTHFGEDHDFDSK